MALLVGFLLLLLGFALVMEPVIRPTTVAVLRPDSDDDDLTPQERKRDLALAALKEIEFDKATGKLSDADYDRLYRRYAGEAVVALREAGDGGTAGQGHGNGSAAPSVPQRPGAPARRPKFCEECGSKLEGGRFCSECGAPIGA